MRRIAQSINGTLWMALGFLMLGLVLRFETGWTGGKPMAEASLTYLIIVGGVYGLVRLLGGGRLRAFLRWFWRGDEG